MKHALRATVICLLSFAFAALCLTGCGDEDRGEGEGEVEGDGGEQSNGSAPRISGLSFSNKSRVVGEESRISGLLDYRDSDGDVRQFFAVITDPDGNVNELPPMAVKDRNGLVFSTLFFARETTFDVAGTHQLEVYLVDAQDNQSNSLFDTINVVE